MGNSISKKAYWALKHANFDLKTMGNHRKLQLNELRDQAYENSLIYKEKTKELHDSKIKNCIFNVGDWVLLFNSRLKIFSGKLKTRGSGPFTITKVFSYGTVELSQPDGPNFKIFSGKLKTHWSGPFTITRVFPYGTIELSQPNGPNFKVTPVGAYEVDGIQSSVVVRDKDARIHKKSNGLEHVKTVRPKKMPNSRRNGSQDSQSQGNASKCKLWHLKKSNIVALGTVYKSDGKQMLRNQALPNDCYKVSIDSSLVDSACIPDVGNNRLNTVKDGVGLPSGYWWGEDNGLRWDCLVAAGGGRVCGRVVAELMLPSESKDCQSNINAASLKLKLFKNITAVEEVSK
nr:reverse transcriptase domain-containing protein [Tanacetum cinerariifolium]